MKPDLTRWNRSGLRRLRYVDGNAATYLETLRCKLFENSQDGADDDSRQALKRYLQLNDQRGHMALEIIRSFSRSVHVLTEYLDAYANEGYLGTATQWESLRRLVHGLDYQPHPPASATTALVLQAKAGQRGILRRGFQTRHSPESGEAVVFETLEDVLVDPALNALRLRNWNRSQESLVLDNREEITLHLDRIVDDLQPGEPVLLESPSWLRPFILNDARPDQDGRATVLTLSSPFQDTLRTPASSLIVHLKAAERLEILGPAMGGQRLDLLQNSLTLTETPTGLHSGHVVYVEQDSKGFFAHVQSVRDRRVSLRSVADQDHHRLDLAQAWLSPARKLPVSSLLGKGNDSALKEKRGSVLLLAGDWSALLGLPLVSREKEELRLFKVSAAKYHPVSFSSPADPYQGYTILTVTSGSGTKLSNPQSIYAPPLDRRWKVDSYIKNDEETKPFSTRLQFGKLQRLKPGDLCAVVYGANCTAGRVVSISRHTDPGYRQVTVDKWQISPADKRCYLHQGVFCGAFREQARPNGWQRNKKALPLAGQGLELADETAFASLKEGQIVVLEQETDTGALVQPFQTTIAAIAADKQTLILAAMPPADAGYTVGNTIIRANAVLAGHGETMPERVLGSGNAALSNQEFLLDVQGVSFVPDPGQFSGVRADIQVRVDGETWTQVPRLGASGPADPHYGVRISEDGFLRLVFGDGVNGRRLPSGENNVRLTWRLGSGLAGNLDAGCFTRPSRPDPVVEGLRQPFPCEGGNDLEDVASLRRSAPASILTLERAVSVADFADLARSHSSVWAARAFARPCQGHERQTLLVVVPAQGRALGESLRATLKDYLLSRAVPGLGLQIESFSSQTLYLSVDLYISYSRFAPDAVAQEVRLLLQEALALKNRAIGEPIFLSEIYQLVEGVRGVDHSLCRFRVPTTTEDNSQVLYPESENAVIHLEHPGSHLVITCHEAHDG